MNDDCLLADIHQSKKRGRQENILITGVIGYLLFLGPIMISTFPVFLPEGRRQGGKASAGETKHVQLVCELVRTLPWLPARQDLTMHVPEWAV